MQEHNELIGWKNLDPDFIDSAIDLMNARVKTHLNIDLTLCERDWIVKHMLREAYTNRCNYTKR